MTQPGILTAISPVDGRYAGKCDELRDRFSEFAIMRYRVDIEARWLIYLAETGAIPALAPFNLAAVEYLHDLHARFSLADAEHVKQIERQTNHDVKAIEYFLQEHLATRPDLKHAIPFLHFACTSEDINNLAYALAIRDARREVLSPLLRELIKALAQRAGEHAADVMLSRTHGQAATPTTMGKEFANFVQRLERQAGHLDEVRVLGKMNGAVGNYNAHRVACPDADWPAITQRFLATLGIDQNPYTAQIEPHDFIAEFCHTLIRGNTILLDLCRDIWGYISLGYFRQQRVAGETGSSTMPHKINPIDFENAEGNLGIANALLQHLAEKLPISRWQRDLSDSTALRNLGVACAHAVIGWRACLAGLAKLAIDADAMRAELRTHWELLGEAIQTVMRKNGIADSYEQLKAFTRGERISEDDIRRFIGKLAIDPQDKQRLLALTPETYIGNAIAAATDLAKRPR